MAEHDEFENQPAPEGTVSWKDRTPEEHAAVFLDLLDLVDATGRYGVGKEGELEFPIIANRRRTTSPAMAEHDEFQKYPVPEGTVSWKNRTPEEHGRALAGLMRYVSAAPRHQKGDTIEFPVLKRLAPNIAHVPTTSSASSGPFASWRRLLRRIVGPSPSNRVLPSKISTPPENPAQRTGPCGDWMPRSRAACTLSRGHSGPHQSR